MKKGVPTTLNKNERGNILVTALLVLVVMNLLGVGSAITSNRESSAATYKTIGSTVYQVAESCTRSAMKWLEQQSSPPSAADLPYQIDTTNLDSIMTGTESASALSKLSGYSFDCEVTFIVTKADDSVVKGESSGAGGSVSESGGYGASGDTSPKYYYQIQANGHGPRNSVKQTFTIVSVKY